MTVKQGHDKKVSMVAFNPSAEWIIASVGVDCTIRIWDFETQKNVLTLSLPQTANCVRWSNDSALVSTTTRDHMMRIIDPRQIKEVASLRCHEGVKPARCEWIYGCRGGDSNDMIASTGNVVQRAPK
jgi:WD40 repeat protein